ncbi:hypothetical protein Desti_2410 [Desulfomonile tiedjei DSM 6799]|uniref:Uncharacterized protein n=1 Tax=Desulfomonile tiedjei (strain ATCC 49306 / DSM 6799 / DCB-1) TaxID=706587 RepID=I4C6A1_DESTA|nr:hypothetical protein Desti_2410 [Desulfomonile tiedjei DSM 6799]
MNEEGFGIAKNSARIEPSNDPKMNDNGIRISNFCIC